MIDHNHFICHFIFGGHLLNIPKKARLPGLAFLVLKLVRRFLLPKSS